MPGKGDSLALSLYGDGVVEKLLADHRRYPLETRRLRIADQPRCDRQLHLRLAIGSEVEGDMRMGHRQPLDRVDCGRQFGAVALEEFEPGWRGVEQVAHLDPRAGWMRRRRRG